MDCNCKVPKILVCDDDEVLLKFYSRVLKTVGLEAVTVENGDDAIKQLESGTCFALVIIDLLMPIRSGWELIEYIRGQQALADIPVIAVTGLATTPEEEDEIKTVCQAVFRKGADFNVEAFIALIKSLI